jgi:hypothetical protein
MAAKTSMKGKHIEVLPLWHQRRYQGVLELGRRYEIVGEPPRYWQIDIGQAAPFTIQRGHCQLVDGAFSGDL